MYAWIDCSKLIDALKCMHLPGESMQPLLQFSDCPQRAFTPFKTQLLKWIGSKQRFAHEIVSFFPRVFGTYFEPFLGSGAVLGTLAPVKAIASDIFEPLMQIWHALQEDPRQLKKWYSDRFSCL